MREDHQTYDSFVGKISPFLLFEMEYHSLSYLVENHKTDRWYPDVNPAAQVAVVGLFAYFEAFCKHQFAAIVNLMPTLLPSFCQKRNQPKVEFSTIVAFNNTFEKNIGFVLAENYDFGTVKAINGLFLDLLLFTPFNEDESKIFSSIAYKRNLIMHHGGYFTLQYLGKETLPEKVQEQAFKDAIKINTDDFYEISEFLFEMAMKITRESVKALQKHPDFTLLKDDKDRFAAVVELLQGIHDVLDEI